MLLFSVDNYLVAKIQRIYETTKFKIKNNTRELLKTRIVKMVIMSIVNCH